MEIIVYIIVNLLLFSSWYALLYRLTVHRLPAGEAGSLFTVIDRILGTVVLCLAQIILTEMILGLLFKKLFAMPLFIFNVSISLGVLVFAMIRPQKLPVKDILKELRDRASYFFNIIKIDWILLTIFILFFISFCFLIFTGYLFPSYSWDALLSHLPAMGFILQSGTIENIPYNGLIYTFINVFPKNIDLFFLWNVIFLKSDVIVDLSQMLFTLSGMLAVYSIAVKLRLKEKYAVYSSFLFFFAPVIILQSTANYVDIAVSVLFLIAINFMLHTGLLPNPLSDIREFLVTNPGEVKDKQFQLSEPEGRILKLPVTSLGFVKKSLQKAKRLFGNKPNTVDKTIALNGKDVHVFLSGLTAGILLGSKGSGPLFIVALSILFLINELKVHFYLKP